MHNKTSFSWENYNKTPIVGIVRGLKIETVREIAIAYSKAGFYTLEITMNTKDAAEIIAEIRSDFPNINVGAGTVCNSDELNEALISGAQFIVTPIIDEKVIKHCVKQNIPVFPGAYTPTEIYRAWTLGASAVKIFPATQLGPKYIKDVLAPLNKIKLLPTGGVSKENIKSFFEAGAIGAGMGSSLLNKELIAKKDFEGLEKHFVEIRNEIKDFLSA